MRTTRSISVAAIRRSNNTVNAQPYRIPSRGRVHSHPSSYIYVIFVLSAYRTLHRCYTDISDQMGKGSMIWNQNDSFVSEGIYFRLNLLLFRYFDHSCFNHGMFCIVNTKKCHRLKRFIMCTFISKIKCNRYNTKISTDYNASRRVNCLLYKNLKARYKNACL